MWGLFMSSAMTAAIHLGPSFTANLEVYKNTNFEEIMSLFGITQKLISDHSEEIQNVKPVENTAPSVLCVRQMNESKEAITRWEGQVEELKRYLLCKELSGIDGGTN